MGAFSSFDRAYRIYTTDKQRGNSSGKELIESQFKESRFNLLFAIALGGIAFFLMRLLLDGDVTVIKAILALALGYFTLSSSTFSLFSGISLFEDWRLLNLYRQIEDGHREKKNE